MIIGCGKVIKMLYDVLDMLVQAQNCLFSCSFHMCSMRTNRVKPCAVSVMSSLYWYGVIQQYRNTNNSKESSMLTTFSPYAFIVMVALVTANKEIRMVETPHWTESYTSHTWPGIKAAGVLRHFHILQYLFYGYILIVWFWTCDAPWFSENTSHEVVFACALRKVWQCCSISRSSGDFFILFWHHTNEILVYSVKTKAWHLHPWTIHPLL